VTVHTNTKKAVAVVLWLLSPIKTNEMEQVGKGLTYSREMIIENP
jgi:hypothetical protein